MPPQNIDLIKNKNKNLLISITEIAGDTYRIIATKSPTTKGSKICLAHDQI